VCVKLASFSLLFLYMESYVSSVSMYRPTFAVLDPTYICSLRHVPAYFEFILFDLIALICSLHLISNVRNV
jgi:hypothetical protein